MVKPRTWWSMRRVKHRDAVALCVISAAFLLAAELTNPALADIYVRYLAPVLDRPALLVLYAVLALFAFTTAFGAILVLVGGWYFLQGRVPRGRFFVGLGVGLTSLSLANRLAYATLVVGTPLAFLIPLATTLTGVGILVGVAAHAAMGQYALLIKRHARAAWRRWRRARRAAQRASGSRQRIRS